ncbi:protein of unknown function [Paenibacillus alvei]|uniref:Uncharacterized protein n=1 Tax=Paenibacillus alvei TaxID=44250 RepID=A0A383RJA4_PAEAL|nr:protein of unknown function [Paenibacillus alvei]
MIMSISPSGREQEAASRSGTKKGLQGKIPTALNKPKSAQVKAGESSRRIVVFVFEKMDIRIPLRATS